MKVSENVLKKKIIRKLKFLIFQQFAVALFALFAVASSSAVLPYGAWPYAAPAWSYAAAVPAVHAPITQYSSWPAAHIAHAPISYAAHVAAPWAPAVVAAPVVKLGASYTAANRGSVHTAPLPGHAVSQTSLNLAPAPGTL